MGWIIPLMLLIAFEAVADVLSKEYLNHGTAKWWLLAIGMYVVANIFWLYAIRHGSGLTRGACFFCGIGCPSHCYRYPLLQRIINKDGLGGGAFGSVSSRVNFLG